MQLKLNTLNVCNWIIKLKWKGIYDIKDAKNKTLLKQYCALAPLLVPTSHWRELKKVAHVAVAREKKIWRSGSGAIIKWRELAILEPNCAGRSGAEPPGGGVWDGDGAIFLSAPTPTPTPTPTRTPTPTLL